jgi:hypothetical protein
MGKNMSDYQITQKDIESMYNYLKIFHPDSASMEYAEDMLRYLKHKVHQIGLNDPAALDELYIAFQKEKADEKQ